MTGKLTMYLEKESYERAGVVGQPHGVKGKRGSKPRWGNHCTQIHYKIKGLTLSQSSSTI
jgi:hypothetical protein